MSMWAFIAGIVVGSVVLGGFIQGIQADPSSATDVGKEVFGKLAQTISVWLGN